MTTETKRKYALTKVDAGDYLLPANNGRTLWRIARYQDGPSTGLEDMPRDDMFWGVWRWTGHVGIDTQSGRIAVADGLEDWSLWEMDASLLRTRAEAIEEAMRMGGS